MSVKLGAGFAVKLGVDVLSMKECVDIKKPKVKTSGFEASCNAYY
jgi:hypothetical protein